MLRDVDPRVEVWRLSETWVLDVISSQHEIKGDIQEKRFIFRKFILSVSGCNLSLPIQPVILCPMLQDFSEWSSLWNKVAFSCIFLFQFFHAWQMLFGMWHKHVVFCASVLMVNQSNLHLWVICEGGSRGSPFSSPVYRSGMQLYCAVSAWYHRAQERLSLPPCHPLKCLKS